MIELLTNFKELKEHTKKKSSLGFKGAIVNYYKELGEKQGFTTVENSSVIKNTINYGKVDLVWIEPNTVFCVEFGLLEDIYKHLFKITRMKPSMTVFILSSNSNCSPEKVKAILDKTPELFDIKNKSVVIDIAGEKAL